MPNYKLHGKPFNDTYRNLFYAKGMILENKVFEYQFNVYEFDTAYNLASLKVGDGKTPYKDLAYIFGAPKGNDKIMCTMAIFYAFTNFVAQTYQTKGSDPSEADPVFVNSVAFNIKKVNVDNWNTAFSWGNHAGLYKSASYVPSWGDVTGKPDLYTKSEVFTKQQVNDLINGVITNLNGQVATLNTKITDLGTSFTNQINALTNSFNAALALKLSSVLIKSATATGPLLLGPGGTANVVVTFPSAFTDANYATTQSVFGTSSLLGSVVIQGVTAKTASSITVIIKNTGLLSLNLNALTVEVIAFKTTTT